MSDTDRPGERDRAAEAEARGRATGSDGGAPAAAAEVAGSSRPAAVGHIVDEETLRAQIDHYRSAHARVREAGDDADNVEGRRGAWDALARLVAPPGGDGAAAEVAYERAFRELGELLDGGAGDVSALAQRVREITDPIFEAVEGDVWDREWPEREWLIPGWLPVGRLGLLSGRGGCGKSRLALQVAARIAHTKPLPSVAVPPLDDDPGAGPAVTAAMDGLDVHQCGPVLFVSWEDERAEIGRRLRALDADKLISEDGIKGIKGRLRFIDARAEGPLWAQSPDGYRFSAELTPTGRKVRATCERMGARLLVVDSLAGAYASDENARHLVRAFCADWDAWASASRCAVMLVSHPPKTPPGAGARAVDADYSGSTDWHNAARWRWSLAPEATGYRLPTVGNKHTGESVDALALRLAKASYGPVKMRVFLAAAQSQFGWRACSAEYAARAAAPAGKAPEGVNDGQATTDGKIGGVLV